MNQWTRLRLGNVCTKIGSGATPLEAVVGAPCGCVWWPRILCNTFSASNPFE